MNPSNSTKPYQILLYYKFRPIEDPQAVRDEHYKFCAKLGILGRILVASEGINGTVSGTVEQMQAYRDYMNAHPLFAGTEFKIDPSDSHAFNKLHVRVKPELVHFRAPVPKPWEKTGKYIEPEEMRQLLRDTPDDVIIVDARSKYEHNIGRFKNAIVVDIDNFRELPKHLEELEQFRDKKIVTYCTGGIKCEKFTPMLMEMGFKDVYQLHGGIVRYGHETDGENFDGSCYVFDNRVVVPINKANPKVIACCEICGTETEKMINCANADCNKHFVICPSCDEKMQGCCSDACLHAPKRREYNPAGQYHRGINSKAYIGNIDLNATVITKKHNTAHQ